jgi:hypothetical protein
MTMPTPGDVMYAIGSLCFLGGTLYNWLVR